MRDKISHPSREAKRGKSKLWAWTSLLMGIFLWVVIWPLLILWDWLQVKLRKSQKNNKNWYWQREDNHFLLKNAATGPNKYQLNAFSDSVEVLCGSLEHPPLHLIPWACLSPSPQLRPCLCWQLRCWDELPGLPLPPAAAQWLKGLTAAKMHLFSWVVTGRGLAKSTCSWAFRPSDHRCWPGAFSVV